MDRRLGVIIRKELKRVFTDRRLVLTVLLLPGLSIAILYSIMGMVLGNMEEDRTVHIFEVEARNAPASVVEYIENMPSKRVELTLVEGTEGLEASKQKLVDKELDLVMVFDATFDEEIADYLQGERPNIDTYFNPVNDYSQDARNYMVGSLLPDYRMSILGTRLGNPDYVRVFTIDLGNDAISVASEEKVTGKIIGGILPFLVTLFLFVGAMSIGIDMVAGEKERGTMATLLLTPVKRETIVLGKLISLGIVAVTATLSSMAGIILSFPFSSRILGRGIELSTMHFTPIQVVELLLTLMLLAGIDVGLIILVSVYSKTVKEAGSYISPVYMLIMISGILAMMADADAAMTHYLIPVYGNIMVLKNILIGEVNWLNFGLNAGVSIVCIGFFITVTRILFRSERLMFR